MRQHSYLSAILVSVGILAGCAGSADDAGGDPAAPPASRSASLEAVGLPDLTIDAERLKNRIEFAKPKTFGAGSCAVREGCVTPGRKRRLMRFDVSTPNIGDADVYLGPPEESPTLFHFDECHHHYHLEGYAKYELLDVSGQVVVAGHKQAFCLMDSIKWDPTAAPAKYTCTNQGISKGWADVYGRALDCQWIDITEVPPGNYALRVTVNESHFIVESDYSNNVVSVPVTIP